MLGTRKPQQQATLTNKNTKSQRFSFAFAFVIQKKRDVHKISARNSGPEMAAPILWAPGILGFFLQEKTPMPIKFLPLGGGSGLF